MGSLNKLFTAIFSCLLLVMSCKEQEKDKIEQDQSNTEAKREYTDNDLLDTIQYQTFNYFWEGAEPNSGMARERLHMDDVYPTSPKNTVTIGGSGFGVMAILVGIERNFISREEGFKRLDKIVDFLAEADRFHGAWPHWLNGETGKIVPFSKRDTGGDLVETSFLIEGLLTVSEYFKNGNDQEKQLVSKIDTLWREVE